MSVWISIIGPFTLKVKLDPLVAHFNDRVTTKFFVKPSYFFFLFIMLRNLRRPLLNLKSKISAGRLLSTTAPVGENESTTVIAFSSTPASADTCPGMHYFLVLFVMQSISKLPCFNYQFRFRTLPWQCTGSNRESRRL